MLQSYRSRRSIRYDRLFYQWIPINFFFLFFFALIKNELNRKLYINSLIVSRYEWENKREKNLKRRFPSNFYQNFSIDDSIAIVYKPARKKIKEKNKQVKKKKIVEGRFCEGCVLTNSRLRWWLHGRFINRTQSASLCALQIVDD